MQQRQKWYALAAMGLLVAGGAGIAGAASSGQDGGEGSGASAGSATVARAAVAAIAHVGGGEVTEFEVDDEANSLYEVEVRGADGREHEVLLDRDFNVVDSEVEDEDD